MMNPTRCRFLVLGLALWGCATPPAPPPQGEFTVTSTFTGGTPAEGRLGRFEVRLRNGTRHFIVLRDLAAGSDGAPLLSWQIALPGSVTYDPGSDSWAHDRSTPGPERPVFNRGLLAPGEELLIRPRIRLLNLPRELTLRYFAFRREDVGLFVYFEQKRENPPRYVRLMSADLEAALLRSDTPDVASHRTVIYPHADQVDASPLTKPVRLDVKLIPLKLTREQALARAGLTTADEATYCETLGGWNVRAGERRALITDRAVTELPVILRLEPFSYHVDAGPQDSIEIEFLRESARFFASAYRLATDREGKRIFLILPKSQLAGFLSNVRGVKDLPLKLDVAADASGAERLTVSW